MKSPWQIGLMVVAFTGVSAYNIAFFKQYNSRYNAPPALEYNWEEAVMQPLTPEPAYESISHAQSEEFTHAELLPIISLKELQNRANEVYVPQDFLAAYEVYDWPARDPFASTQDRAPKSTNRRVKPVTKNAEKVAPIPPLSEPECNFTGTLIESNLRLALIDGIPRPVGTWLGNWQLAVIESDYILLKAGNSTYRIELNVLSSGAIRQKESL